MPTIRLSNIHLPYLDFSPRRRKRQRYSLRNSREATATRRGFAVTNTTALVTDIRSNDAVQDQKWMAIESVETVSSRRSLRVTVPVKEVCIGERNLIAPVADPITAPPIASLYDAMISAGASANLMNMAAKETASTPSDKAMGTRGAAVGVIGRCS